MNPMNTRRALPMLCMLAASLSFAQGMPVPAQPPPYIIELRGADIPMGEAGMIFYGTLRSMTEGGQDSQPSPRRRQLQGQLQVDDATWQALLVHVRAVLEQELAFQRAQGRNICARRRELSTVQALGAALDENRRLLNIQREQLLAGAQSVLGAAGKARLDALIVHSRNGTVVRSMNHAQAMIAEKRSAAEFLTSLCDSPELA